MLGLAGACFAMVPIELRKACFDLSLSPLLFPPKGKMAGRKGGKFRLPLTY